MTLQTLHVIYSVKFSSVLYPILHHELNEGIQKIGYELSAGWPQRVPVTSRITGQGEAGRKGKTMVMINSDSKQLLVSDETAGSAVSNFDDLQNMFSEEFGIDFSDIVNYYAFTGDFIYYTEKPAFSTVSEKIKSPLVEEISRIMGHELGAFQISAAIKGLEVNSGDWYDLLIRPSYERDDAYIIRVVIRNPDKEVIKKMITEFETKILDVINYIEA